MREAGARLGPRVAGTTGLFDRGAQDTVDGLELTAALERLGEIRKRSEAVRVPRGQEVDAALEQPDSGGEIGAAERTLPGGHEPLAGAHREVALGLAFLPELGP